MHIACFDNKIKLLKPFATMDIETISVDACMSAKAGVQIPVMITFAGPTCMSAKAGKHFLIDHLINAAAT